MKGKIHFGLSLALAAALFGMCGCKKENEKTYENALKYYEIGYYADAVEGYKLAISQGETSPVIYADLGLAYAKMGERALAEENLMKALTAEPENKAILKRIGIYYSDFREWNEAVSYLTKALPGENEKDDEGSLEVKGFLADAYVNLNRFEEAIPLYNSLIEADYFALEHIIRCGECYLKLHQFSAASQYFDMLEKERSVKPSHYLYVFKACRDAEDYGGAARYFEKGKSLCGATPMKEMTEGKYYVCAGMFDMARELVNKEAEGEEDLTKAWLCMQEGNFSEAEEIYKQLAADKISLNEVYSQYMALCILREQYDNAEILLNRLKESEPEENIMKCALWNEIILYERKQEYETALDKLAKFRERFGADEEAERESQFIGRVLEK